jgi:hypothetical protein
MKEKTTKKMLFKKNIDLLIDRCDESSIEIMMLILLMWYRFLLLCISEINYFGLLYSEILVMKNSLKYFSFDWKPWKEKKDIILNGTFIWYWMNGKREFCRML